MSKLSRSLSRMKQLVLALQPFSPARQITARRELLWRLLQGHADTIGFERNGVHWSAPVRSSITAALFSKGEYQHESMPALFGWLSQHSAGWRRGQVVVNVGANIGDTCVALALKTGKRVLACEPVPEAFSLLQANVRANRLEHLISCHQVAIAARSGTAEMVCPQAPEGSEVRSDNGVQGFGKPIEQCSVFPVTLTPLDAWLMSTGLQADEVSLVWSDTQGFESEVIESGLSLWHAGVPLWVEVWPRGLEAHGGVAKFLALTRQYFQGFLTEDALLNGAGQAQDIRQLEGTVQALTGRAFTDVLLIP